MGADINSLHESPVIGSSVDRQTNIAHETSLYAEDASTSPDNAAFTTLFPRGQVDLTIHIKPMYMSMPICMPMFMPMSMPMHMHMHRCVFTHAHARICVHPCTYTQAYAHALTHMRS
jgi:hypothetical protein